MNVRMEVGHHHFTPNPLMMVMVMEMKLPASNIGSIYIKVEGRSTW